MTACSAFDFIVYTLYKHYKGTKIYGDDDDDDDVKHWDLLINTSLRKKKESYDFFSSNGIQFRRNTNVTQIFMKDMERN